MNRTRNRLPRVLELTIALLLLMIVSTPAAPQPIVLPATETIVCYCCAGNRSDCERGLSGNFTHPTEGTLQLPVGEAVPGKVRACLEYGSTIQRSKGQIKVQVELVRDDVVVDQARFSGRVRRTRQEEFDFGTAYYGCSGLGAIGPLEVGDLLVYNLTYRKFPNLTKTGIIVLTAGVIR